VPTGCNGKCTDFDPSTGVQNPSFDVGVDPGIASSFGTPTGAAPCVTEPENGALFPNNWLRPRVRVANFTGYVKITFHADNETTDLVVYTKGGNCGAQDPNATCWKLPQSIWANLASHIVESDISVTVQLQGANVSVVKFQVAPVGAGGSMVFWSIDPSTVGKNLAATGSDGKTLKYSTAAIANDSYLDAFKVGDETTVAAANGVPALSIADVKQPTVDNNGNTRTAPRCIGCHVGTPDGDYVAFNDFWPWSVAFAGVKPDASGAVGYVLPAYDGATCSNWNTCNPAPAPARTYVQEPWAGPITFSSAFWTSDGTQRKAIMVTQLPDASMPWSQSDKAPGQLIWLDTNSTATTMINGVPVPTQNTAWGVLSHSGDRGGAAFPTWSNDGANLVYSSSTYPSDWSVANNNSPSNAQPPDQDGRLNIGTTDLYSIPIAAGASGLTGGSATKVTWSDTTASGTPGDANRDEYYAGFSPDSKLLNFTAVPTGMSMYANDSAELFVSRFGGVTARRLAANDPPQCTGLSSPGVNNHWGKWSPDAQPYGNFTYYWIIFSSNRYGLPNVQASNDGMSATVKVSQLYITAIKTDEVGGITTFPAIYLWNQPQNRMNNTPAWQNFHTRVIIN
jgi:hypothetical protein